MTRPTPAWLIERLAQGELDAAAAEEVRARLRAEGRTPDEVLAALDEANRAFLAKVPARQAAAAIRARLTETPAAAPRSLLWMLPLVGVAATMVLMIAKPPREGNLPGADMVEQTRDKGPGLRKPKLVVYRKTEARNERLADGAHAAAGDRLQLGYINREGGFGVIVSLDGGAHVTLHLPDEGVARAAALQTGEVHVPASYVLDEAPAFERFFLVTSATPFDVAPIVQAAQALAGSPAATSGALTLPAGFRQSSFRLDKRHKETP